ncbi:MAG: hypothetical protein WC699_03520 [Bacteroidales bacterium]|jgi:hypothetical protein
MKSLKTFINEKETPVFKFKPDRAFYQAIGINHKRWGLIYRGEIEPVVSELQRIADYFKVDFTELMDLKTKNHD